MYQIVCTVMHGLYISDDLIMIIWEVWTTVIVRAVVSEDQSATRL